MAKKKQPVGDYLTIEVSTEKVKWLAEYLANETLICPPLPQNDQGFLCPINKENLNCANCWYSFLIK